MLFILENSAPAQNVSTNGDFETGALAPWGSDKNAGLGVGRNSVYGGWLGGQNNAVGELIQWVYIPADASIARWSFWWRSEVASQQPQDVMHVFIQMQDEEPVLLLLPATGTLNQWRQASVDLSPYAGKGFHASFLASTDASVPTTFRVDDVSIISCQP